MAGHGGPWPGVAKQVVAWRGEVFYRVVAGHGLARLVHAGLGYSPGWSRLGLAAHGMEGRGVYRGSAWRCWARLGWPCLVAAWFLSRHVPSRHGMVRCGGSGQMLGKAWFLSRQVALRQGTVRPSGAGPGRARRGMETATDNSSRFLFDNQSGLP